MFKNIDCHFLIFYGKFKNPIYLFQVDLEKDGEITQMFEWIENHPKLGRVDICVPNAGFSTNVSLLNGNFKII